jgi:molybdopterin biosynthesis enzyme
MDGFAVLAEDTFTANLESPITLEVLGTIGAGEFLSLKKLLTRNNPEYEDKKTLMH